MLKFLKVVSLKFVILVVGLVCVVQVMVVDLIVVFFGGVNKSVQIKVFYEFYQKVIGNRIVVGEYNGEMVKVKVMVDINSVFWDLVEVELLELLCGCDEGLFEEFDLVQFGKIEDFVFGVI